MSEQELLTMVWTRSGGRCECHTISHGHDLRCNRQLVWPNRGRSLGRGAWDIKFHGSGGSVPTHAEVVCVDCLQRE
jgi:hypothetical protein